MSPPQTIALAEVPAYCRDVVKPKGHRGPLHFGEKVKTILGRNAEAVPPIEPSTPKALADLVGETKTNPKVYRALKSGNPKLKVALKISKALGESLDFLADSEQPIEGRAEGDRFTSLAATLTPGERDALADFFQSRNLRPLLGAHQKAIQEGRAGRSAKPTARPG